MVSERISGTEYTNLIGLMRIVQRAEEFAPRKYLTAAEITWELDAGTHGYRTVDVAMAGSRYTLSQTGFSSTPDRTR